jgi:serine protease Do
MMRRPAMSQLIGFSVVLTVITCFDGALARGSTGATHAPPVFGKPVPTSITDLKAMERHVEALAKKLSPTVVALEIGDASGSGVIISSNGFVLTAGHVVEAPDRKVRITFPDGKVVNGKTVGTVADSDAGLLKITDSGMWPHADMAELKESRIGDWVLTLGHPGGFDAKRSLVTRLGRIIYVDSDDLQTDCTISPGDSGGPVFDMDGEIIGVHSYIRTSMSENFHVPVSNFVDDVKRLMKAQKAVSSK